MDNLLTIKLDGCIIITNKYRTVLNGSSNVWDAMTETCYRLRGRMESRREVIQELLPERRFASRRSRQATVIRPGIGRGTPEMLEKWSL